jgi:Cdc6-like AAA superfamily ATPase
MELEINSENLFDSPYRKEKDLLFSFNDQSLSDLADDLCRGNKTCYLVSGYRGVGKSSFINKLELLSQDRKKADESVCFVSVSFAKYNTQSFLIRKLLRQLFINITSQKVVDKSTQEGKKAHELLEHLHKQTFHQVRHQVTSEATEVKHFSIALNYQFAIDVLNFIFPSLALGAIASGVSFAFPGVPILFLLLSVITSLISVGWHYSITKTDSKKMSSESLYDEEIAGYHFLDILGKLNKLKIRVIFVLDELDKVDDDEAKNLVNEMKPFLVSGEASFIVVSGQKLFYKFYDDRTRDDSVLSSLFSRVIHVPLANPGDLKLFFKKHLIVGEPTLTSDESNSLEYFLDQLIFESRLIHRRFISLIRQHSVWKDGRCFFVAKPSIQQIPYRQILDSLTEIRSTNIAADGLDVGIKDFMVMTIYIHVQKKLQDYTTSSYLK